MFDLVNGLTVCLGVGRTAGGYSLDALHSEGAHKVLKEVSTRSIYLIYELCFFSRWLGMIGH